MKYIDAELLREKIEKTYKSEIKPWLSGVSAASAIYEYVLPLIASLQQEQPDLPGIEESGIPGKDYIPVEWVDACEKYGKWKIVKQEQPEVDLEKVCDAYCKICGHYSHTTQTYICRQACDYFKDFKALLNARNED